MDSTAVSSDLGEKLILILQKLTSPDSKTAEDIFLEKLLTAVRNELTKNGNKLHGLQGLIEWLSVKNNLFVNSPTILAFLAQLICILSENEDIFVQIQDSIVNPLLDNLKKYQGNNMNLKVASINLLTSVLNHKSGCQWILNMKLWKDVIDRYLTKHGYLVERKAIQFLTKFLEIIKWDSCVFQDILRGVLSPLEHYRKEFEMGRMNENNVKLLERKLEEEGEFVLKAYTIILETWILTATTRTNISFLRSHEIEPFWKFLLETNNNVTFLEKVSTSYTLHSLCACYMDMDCLIPVRGLPDCVFEIFKILVKRKKIYNVINLAKYCQLFWNKITLNGSNNEDDLENHFIIIQLVPALVLIKKPKMEDCFLDIYINKLSDLISGNTLRLGYLIRDAIKYGEIENSEQYAEKAILSVSYNLETLNLKKAVLIFQALTNILKSFIPIDCDSDYSDEKDRIFSGKDSLLLFILRAICGLIEKFKINWTESLESLCLLKISSTLLNNPNLSSHLSYQSLTLIKLAIVNFMPPNMALLVDKIEGTSLECLINILYNKLHHPDWEVRDSCVEVIEVIAELAETKYPLFQNFLIRRNYCELMLSMIHGDSDLYVRASALKALSRMIRIEDLRNRYLNNVDLAEKVTNIMRNETEGMVRREAALLAKEMFEIRSNSSTSLFLIMGYAATRDLHWEVRVNALIFWEKVIQVSIADQGMIDGFFPSITFSKDNKKIVSLTNSEIKSRLNKVLNELSDNGCLHVLISALKDDYDFKVVEKSAQILTDLLDVLKRYDMLEKESVEYRNCDKSSMKRKSSDESFPEKKISCSVQDVRQEMESGVNKSNRIIEEIVNESDLDLLGGVYNPGSVVSPPKMDGVPLTKIKPEVFLSELQNLNINSFVESKRKWLWSKDDELDDLINDILTLSIENVTNVLDCY